MEYNDYIIAFDENGSPYIAHAGLMDRARGAVNAAANRVQQVANQAKGVGRGVRQNHKYILKVNENGRTRYFYKQEEVKAYYEAKKRGIKNAAEYAQNVVKNKASEVADKAKQGVSNAKNTVREATGQAARDRMDAAAEKYPTLKQNLDKQNAALKEKEAKTGSAATKYLNSVGSQVQADIKAKESNIFNRKARQANLESAKAQTEQYSKAYQNAKNEEQAQRKQRDEASSEYGLAEFQYNRNKEAYDKSLAGAVDRTAAKVRETASNVRDAASNAGRAVKQVAEDVSGVTAKRNAEASAAAASQARQDSDRADRVAEENRKAYEANKTRANRDRYYDSKHDASQAYQNYADAALQKIIDNSVYRNTPLGKAESEAKAAKELASTAYNKAKDSANNTVTNAKNRFERMKSEFRDKAVSTAKDIAGYDERDRRDYYKEKVDNKRANGETPTIRENTNASRTQKDYNKTPLGMIENARNAISSAKDTAEKASTAVKDKAEDLSAKAKSTAQSVKESAQGMIENARSSTAKAVNEAWDKIPKNADGTVNPFDSNFQSAYNDWKSKKDKYDGSLTGQAKAAAEKATDSVKDMIDQAKKTAKDVTQQISDNLDVKQLQKNLERDMKNHGYSLEDAYNQHKDWLKTMQSGQLPEEHKEYYKKMSELEDEAYKELKAKQSAKKYFNEYSDNDSDFDEKNYSKENRVEDTDFYTFKRNDGKSVVLEEDMKWVLPKGVDVGDPAIKSALKKIANSGNFKSYDDWLENANDILGDAIEKVRDKEK